MDRRAWLLCLTFIVAVQISPCGQAALERSAMCLDGVPPHPALSTGLMNESGPGVVWRANIGKSDGTVIGSDGSSYTLRYVDFSDPYHRILDARDPQGKLTWSKSLNVSLITAPSLSSDGAILLVMEKAGEGGAITVLKLDREGEVVWESTQHLNDGSYYWTTSPRIDQSGAAYFAIRETWITASQSFRHNYSFYRVSSSGNVQSMGSFIRSDIADMTGIVGEGEMYALTVGNEVYALDLDGTVRWNCSMVNMAATDLMGMSVATMSNGTVLISAGCTLTAIDPSGQILWESWQDGNVVGRVRVDKDDVAYLRVQKGSYGPGPAGLCAIGPNGTRLWKSEIGTDSSTDPVIDGDRAIIFGSDHFIYSVGLDGDLLWSYDAGLIVDSVMINDKGRLFFTYYDVSSHGSVLVACQGVPKVTWADWIARNSLLAAASAMVVLASLFLVVRYWRNRRSP